MEKTNYERKCVSPLVSIIIPAYNEEKYIIKCLSSLKKQSYPRYEIIFVDDGSSDRTKEIAEQYADTVITQAHQGAGVARNNGAKKSKGSILVFIDADMFIDNDYLKHIVAPIIKGKAVATSVKEEYVANVSNIWSYCFQIDNNLAFNKRIPLTKETTSDKFRAIKKQSFIKLGGYKEKSGYGEDKILKKPEALIVSSAICYHYNPETLKDVFFSARWMGRSKALKKTKKNLLRYSIINSLVISLKKIFLGAPLEFLFYKVVFDIGICIGILYKNKNQNYAK